MLSIVNRRRPYIIRLLLYFTSHNYFDIVLQYSEKEGDDY